MEMQEMFKALVAFQKELPTVSKSNTAKAGSFSYKYADLTDVTEKIIPLLTKHGLAFTAMPTTIGERFVLAYKLVHTSGDYLSGTYPLPERGSPQEIGSAITYARRYALVSITGVAPGGDDDDAAAAMKTVTANKVLSKEEVLELAKNEPWAPPKGAAASW